MKTLVETIKDLGPKPEGAKGAQLFAMQEYAGDPTNNVVPWHMGAFCMDTSGAHLYWASTAISSGWKKLNN